MIVFDNVLDALYLVDEVGGDMWIEGLTPYGA